MTKTEILVICAIISIICLILVPAFDKLTVEYVPDGTGIIIEKTYAPPRTESHMTFITNSDGDVTPVLSEDYHAEKWIIIVNHNYNTFSIHCDSNTWGQFDKGDRCSVYIKQGKLMKHGYSISPIYLAEKN